MDIDFQQYLLLKTPITLKTLCRLLFSKPFQSRSCTLRWAYSPRTKITSIVPFRVEAVADDSDTPAMPSWHLLLAACSSLHLAIPSTLFCSVTSHRRHAVVPPPLCGLGLGSGSGYVYHKWQKGGKSRVIAWDMVLLTITLLNYCTLLSHPVM